MIMRNAFQARINPRKIVLLKTVVKSLFALIIYLFKTYFYYGCDHECKKNVLT